MNIVMSILLRFFSLLIILISCFFFFFIRSRNSGRPRGSGSNLISDAYLLFIFGDVLTLSRPQIITWELGPVKQTSDAWRRFCDFTLMCPGAAGSRRSRIKWLQHILKTSVNTLSRELENSEANKMTHARKLTTTAGEMVP